MAGRGAGFLVPCRRSLPSYWVLNSMIIFAPMVSTEQLAEVLNVLTPAGPVDIFSCSRDCVRSPCRIHFDAKARDAKFPGNIGALTCAGHIVAMYVSQHPEQHRCRLILLCCQNRRQRCSRGNPSRKHQHAVAAVEDVTPAACHLASCCNATSCRVFAETCRTID
jgi:hypothetical protein